MFEWVPVLPVYNRRKLFTEENYSSLRTELQGSVQNVDSPIKGVKTDGSNGEIGCIEISPLFQCRMLGGEH